MEKKPSDPHHPHRSLEGALHEVSNALTVLLGWVAEANGAGADESKREHALAIVEQRARSARDLARRAIGAAVPPTEPVSFSLLVDEVRASLRLEAMKRGQSLICSGDAEGLCVALSEDVAHIVTNLALNAMAHAPARSVIVLALSASERDGSVSVEVRDDGPGIDETRAERVFEGESTRSGGAGVGLRHARALARAAGGELLLVQQGDGAVFRLRWPIVEATGTQVEIALPSKGRVLAGHKILVLEDDADVSELLTTALCARGAEVMVASSRAEFEVKLSGATDAVLLDLSPIAEDIRGAMALVQSRAPSAAVVFITGSAESLPEGVTAAWVRKPFEIAELVAAIVHARSGLA